MYVGQISQIKLKPSQISYLSVVVVVVGVRHSAFTMSPYVGQISQYMCVTAERLNVRQV